MLTGVASTDCCLSPGTGTASGSCLESRSGVRCIHHTLQCFEKHNMMTSDNVLCLIKDIIIFKYVSGIVLCSIIFEHMLL